MLINYDIHTAVCDNCENVCTGTSGDSRGNLPQFDFNYDTQLFSCGECGAYCKAHYEEWNDKNERNDDDVTDVTAHIMPLQHAVNVFLNNTAVQHAELKLCKKGM